MYFEPWPWKELQLVLSTPQAADLWRHSLQELRDGLVTLMEGCSPCQATGSMEYWLRCQYVEVQRQNEGVVHAVMAMGSFAGLRLWKAHKVCTIYVSFS